MWGNMIEMTVFKSFHGYIVSGACRNVFTMDLGVPLLGINRGDFLQST